MGIPKVCVRTNVSALAFAQAMRVPSTMTTERDMAKALSPRTQRAAILNTFRSCKRLRSISSMMYGAPDMMSGNSGELRRFMPSPTSSESGRSAFSSYRSPRSVRYSVRTGRSILHDKGRYQFPCRLELPLQASEMKGEAKTEFTREMTDLREETEGGEEGMDGSETRGCKQMG